MWEEYYYKRLEFYLLYLKSRYLSAIEMAVDKAFAEEYYRKNLFEENIFIPFHTVFFQELLSKFIRLQKLGYVDYLEQIMVSLAEIRTFSSDALEDACLYFMFSDKSKKHKSLPKSYKTAIKNGIYTLDDILQHERNAQLKTDEEVVDILAFYQATQILAFEFKPTEDLKASLLPSDLSLGAATKVHGWTRIQQVLFFYYLFLIADIDRNRSNVTDCAKVIHVVLDIPFTNITYSEYLQKTTQSAYPDFNKDHN